MQKTARESQHSNATNLSDNFCPKLEGRVRETGSQDLYVISGSCRRESSRVKARVDVKGSRFAPSLFPFKFNLSGAVR